MFLAEPLRHGWTTLRASKRMLFLASSLDFLVCLPPTVYVMRQVHGLGAHRADALAVAQHFDADFMSDVHGRTSGFDDDLTALCWASIALFFLLRPLVVGGYVGLAASSRRVRFPQFVRDGGGLYWKFLRLAVLAGLAAYLLSLAAKPLLDQVKEWAELRSEPTADRYKFVTNLVVIGAMHVVAVIFDYARVGLRVGRPPGVLRELGRAALFVLQHPARTLSLYVLTLAVELGAIVAFGWLIQIADGGYFATSAIVLVLVQIVVTVREAARLLHIAGAWQIRSAEAGDEPRPPGPITPDPETPDVLRVPLPWNVR